MITDARTAVLTVVAMLAFAANSLLCRLAVLVTWSSAHSLQSSYYCKKTFPGVGPYADVNI